MNKQLNLYTDQRNFDTLKCLLVSLTNGVQFQTHIVNPNLLPTGALGLPALEVEPNKFLSDITAILIFLSLRQKSNPLFPRDDEKERVHVEEFLDMVVSSKLDVSVLSNLNSRLLETGSKYLVGKKLSIADVSVWAEIHKEVSKHPKFLNSQEYLSNWYESLGEEKNFKIALSKFDAIV